MREFITLDFNGWLDHILPLRGVASSIGLRSCLYKVDFLWLMGSQALAAARGDESNDTLIEADQALRFTAGIDACSETERSALPSALWQLAGRFQRTVNRDVHLAFIIHDDQHFGSPQIRENTGNTNLEAFYQALYQARPEELRRSKIELIWRSVATLKAAIGKSVLGDEEGAVLVININRRVSWTVLQLRSWSRKKEKTGSIRIVRKSDMENCAEGESWTAQRINTVRQAFERHGTNDHDQIQRWTRLLEILATDMPEVEWKDFGIDVTGLEHLSWPTSNFDWETIRTVPPFTFENTSLPAKLLEKVERFVSREYGRPLGIVLESPAGKEMITGAREIIRQITDSVGIWCLAGYDIVHAASDLAHELGKNPDKPAWLDHVPGIELKVRDHEREWLPVVDRDEAIPAGETYHSESSERRRVSLAPGIEHIHLHMRRGEPRSWDERYSGHHTGHTIRPSEHVRIVEPLASVRPLSSEARIEIIEHHPSGKVQAVSGSIKWSEMAGKAPSAFRSIPELYIFESSPTGWEALHPLLRETVEAYEREGKIEHKLKDRLYKCINKQWKDRVFPLGSDGEPPRFNSSNGTIDHGHRAAITLLDKACKILLGELERAIADEEQLRVGQANRLHMPLTWLFVGCPEEATKLLLDAMLHPEGKAGRTLHMDNDFASWSIYSGFGRAVKDKTQLKTACDELIPAWESDKNSPQDKFLLAAITHPMARRVIVRELLIEDRDRFDRIKRFLKQQLQNVLDKNNDPRPSRIHASLELRYITMGFRGLCQIRYSNPDWLPTESDESLEIHDKLLAAANMAGRPFEKDLVNRTAPYLIGEGEDPTMPGGF